MEEKINKINMSNLNLNLNVISTTNKSSSNIHSVDYNKNLVDIDDISSISNNSDYNMRNLRNANLNQEDEIENLNQDNY